MPYRILIPEKIVETLETLQIRIGSRFPESSLCNVSSEVIKLGKEATDRVQWMNRPLRLLWFTQLSIIGLLIFAFIFLVGVIEFPSGKLSSLDYIQALDAMSNLVVLCGAIALFLVSLEIRFKRSRALAGLNEIRAVMHVIDMHQLTKDPDVLFGAWKQTPVSPNRLYDPLELTRYLTYCSELLALTSKIAALYGQGLPDSSILEAVNDLERLSASLCQKTGQKISEVHSIISNLPMGAG